MVFAILAAKYAPGGCVERKMQIGSCHLPEMVLKIHVTFLKLG